VIPPSEIQRAHSCGSRIRTSIDISPAKIARKNCDKKPMHFQPFDRSDHPRQERGLGEDVHQGRGPRRPGSRLRKFRPCTQFCSPANRQTAAIVGPAQGGEGHGANQCEREEAGVARKDGATVTRWSWNSERVASDRLRLRDEERAWLRGVGRWLRRQAHRRLRVRSPPLSARWASRFAARGL
jgi:hypothetical protein